MTRLLTLSLLFPAAISHADDQYYVQRLAQNGIEPNRAAIQKYLESLHPRGGARLRIESLIQQLGADKFEVREEATRQLLRSPGSTRLMLIEATNSNDPEVRWRARAIVEQADQHSEDLFYSVMQVIKSREIAGLVPSILASNAYLEKPHLRFAMRDALAAAARDTDVPVLVSALSHKSPHVRVAAIVTMPVVHGEAAFELIEPLLDDEDDHVRLSAARVLANGGQRACLAVLLDLLNSKDHSVRLRAIAILRNLTGQRFGFYASADIAKRQAAVHLWRDWIVGEGATAELHFPLDELREYSGHILVCNYSGNLVVEIDDKGNETWKKTDLDHPWGVQALPNGNRLVAACNGKYVVELDPAGKQVWRKDGLPGNPLSVQRLDNGNTLVSTGSANKAMEIAPDGTIAWEIAIGGFVADARRLPNGLTLIANYTTGEVVEVDRSGKSGWKIGGFKNTRGAQRLPNGNTLVTDNGNQRIVECDRVGNIVWKYEGLNSPYDSQRLFDGRTLIGDASGLRLVDQAGKTIWRRRMTSTGRIFAY